MNFLIRQNSTLPKLELNFIGESRTGYNQNIDPSSNFYVTFSMYEKETKNYSLQVNLLYNNFLSLFRTLRK